MQRQKRTPCPVIQALRLTSSAVGVIYNQMVVDTLIREHHTDRLFFAYPDGSGNGLALLNIALGGLCLGLGLRELRSKVIVDKSGINVRTIIRWRYFDWSALNGFLIEPRRSIGWQRWLAIVVVPQRGRPIVPHALASPRHEDTLPLCTWLESQRVILRGDTSRQPNAS